MSNTFIAQFGETLLKASDGTTVSPAEALSGKDHVLLYFSAKWCGPCRSFTPHLIEFYNNIQSSKNIEVVFCSLDSDEDQYKEYCSKMPWLCMPFQASETETMARKYNAQGIPHLVVVDGSSGEVITEDGTDGVRNDKDGFPWKPKTFGELWPAEILSSKDSEGKLLASDSIKDKYLMLYFSAHWCPPCRAFTPKLSESYKKLKAQRSDFELVFVSSDRDESSFDEYFGTMSFCALPFEHRKTKAALSKMFKVSGIPTLVMLGPASEDGSRPLINGNIRSFIEKEDFDEFPFVKKNFGDLSSGAEDINDVKTLVIFHENGDDEEQDAIKEIVKQAASKIKDDESKETINILWAFDPKGLAPRVRSLTGLPAMSDDAAMVLLDIPDNGGYYSTDVTDITEEAILNFITNPGERKQLG